MSTHATGNQGHRTDSTRQWAMTFATWFLAATVLLSAGTAHAQRRKQVQVELPYPPTLKGGEPIATSQSDEVLKASTDTIQEGVKIAATAPVIDLMYFPGQDYLGKPWSNWGDSLYANGKFYASIGDHFAPRGTALVYEYDPESRKIRILANLRRLLETGDATHDPADVPVTGEDVKRGPDTLLAEDENYTPGKIHTRLDMGRDGWLYYATHRGSGKTTSDAFGYRGDSIYRTHPESGKTEIVAHLPLAKHAMPASVLDPQRMIFYAGTAAGADAEGKSDHFIAYDIENSKLLKVHPTGFGRYAILDPQTGRVFWDGAKRTDPSVPMMYDPETNEVTEAANVPHVRSATRATDDGWVYGTSDRSADLWGFNVRTGELAQIGNGAVGTQTYVTSMEIDPTGRYLYYIPGAHGGAARDGSPVVQFDLKTRTRKVLAFLHPYLYDEHGFLPEGTFGIALDDKGERLFVAWNGKRHPDVKAWESCAAMVLHIPESERQP